MIALEGLFHLPQNIPLALAIVVFSSLGFAGGATIQHLAVSKTQHGDAENPSMSLREIFGLLTNPLWLVGTGTIVVGASLHAVGLALARSLWCSRWASWRCRGRCCWLQRFTSSARRR